MEMAAFFAQVGRTEDRKFAGQKLGGTAVEQGKPLVEVIADVKTGEVKHERTNEVTAPKFPFTCQYEADDKATRREKLAAWISSKDNPYFAHSYVNRLWGYLFGVGVMEPIDDIRAGNPPTNPELLDYLTAEFIKSGFNVRHVVTLICMSRTYQLSVATHKWNEDDKTNYSHAVARRLPAEVLYDLTIHEEEPLTPEQVAAEYGLPLEAVREAIAYCEANPEVLEGDFRREEALMAATGRHNRKWYLQSQQVMEASARATSS